MVVAKAVAREAAKVAGMVEVAKEEAARVVEVMVAEVMAVAEVMGGMEQQALEGQVELRFLKLVHMSVMVPMASRSC